MLFAVGVYSQQTDYNTKKGAVANGYDVIEYFNNKAVKGSKKITTKYDGVSFRFSSEENLKKFTKNPKMYVPQYGGYCAYAIGLNGEKVAINPKTFEIRDRKLYLFYNAWGTNTLALWTKENPEWKIIKGGDVIIENGKEYGFDMIEVPKITLGTIEVGPVWFSVRPDSAWSKGMIRTMDKVVKGAAFATIKLVVLITCGSLLSIVTV